MDIIASPVMPSALTVMLRDHAQSFDNIKSNGREIVAQTELDAIRDALLVWRNK